MSRHVRLALCSLAVVVAFAAVSCPGCGPKIRTYPVTGLVLLANGKPFAGAAVSFQSADGKLSARGVANREGRFVLGTFRTGDGVPAGTYRAVVQPPAAGDPDRPPTIVLPAKYSDFKASGLEFTVGSGKNDFTIRVE